MLRNNGSFNHSGISVLEEPPLPPLISNLHA
jgi:hypothetical protein